MGINAHFHFRLPPTGEATLLEKQGFKKKGALWTLKGTDGVFRWKAAKAAPTLIWDPHLRIDTLGDSGLKKELLAVVKLLATRVTADAVACVPDTSSRAQRSQFVPTNKLTAKKLFAASDDLADSIPDDIREMLGLDDD